MHSNPAAFEEHQTVYIHKHVCFLPLYTLRPSNGSFDDFNRYNHLCHGFERRTAAFSAPKAVSG